MTLEKLKEYRSICQRIKQLNKKIDYEECKDIEIVKGKVVGSSPRFPYIETHMSVEMYEPKKLDESIRKKLMYEREREKLMQQKEEIEDYIDSISNILVKTILQYIIIEGKTLSETGKEVGYSKGRISQIIKKFLKD